MELRLWGTITGNLDRSYVIKEELKKIEDCKDKIYTEKVTESKALL